MATLQKMLNALGASLPPVRGNVVHFRGDAIRVGPSPRVALIGTFSPRRCGIATFTRDLRDSLSGPGGNLDVDVYALDDPRTPLDYEDNLKAIRQHDPASYRDIAHAINLSGVDAVWVQHEYGIYGGPDGANVCDLVDNLAPPVVLTLHTVLTDPTENQRRILCHLVRRSARVMVMSEHGREKLVELYDTDPALIEVIPHGAPDRPFGRDAQFKRRFGLEGRQVLMTFGLLGPGKGLERVIEALPAIVAAWPETVYMIVGATHPNCLTSDGESYREQLQALAERLGVARNIQWENRFLDTDELLDRLEACDVYITPYGNLQQSTSGTLSYAVALGRAVVSTPYEHARELLADGAGVLIEPNSSTAIAEAVIDLLDHPDKLQAVKQAAYAKGRDTIWARYAERTSAFARIVMDRRPQHVSPGEIPALTAMLAMSDGTGILQHSCGIVPDRAHGYCLDDNARALMVMNVTPGLNPALRLSRSVTYASFVQSAWNPDARRFRNFMGYDRRWVEETGSEDSNARALIALGHTVEHARDPELGAWAFWMFQRVAPHLMELRSPRSMAFMVLAAASLLRRRPKEELALRLLKDGAGRLSRLYAACRRDDWRWFETSLAYDNPRLSQALIEAGRLCENRIWSQQGLESLAWIVRQQTAPQGHFRPVGCEGFGEAFAIRPFDQQPLEALAAIEAVAAAYAVQPNEQWLDHAAACYQWFFGGNDRRVILADVATGRCFDGVTACGRNDNTGAESILAFHLARHAAFSLLRSRTLLRKTGGGIESEDTGAAQSVAHTEHPS